MTDNNSNTFLKITNRDIYDKIESMIASNSKQHAEIVTHQQTTNGKVKLNKWIATTALTLVILTISIVIGAFIP